MNKHKIVLLLQFLVGLTEQRLIHWLPQRGFLASQKCVCPFSSVSMVKNDADLDFLALRGSPALLPLLSLFIVTHFERMALIALLYFSSLNRYILTGIQKWCPKSLQGWRNPDMLGQREG